jgi:hypothetical protein
MPGAEVGLQGQSEALDHPAWFVYLWRSGKGLDSHLLASLPVAAESFPDDAASLGWVGEGQLAICAPAYAGLEELNWRLITIETKRGGQTLVDDHLPARTPVVALDGVLFYCRQAGADHWELWAASPDGLAKRLLFKAPGSESLAVTDAHGGLLLLNRQYFNEDDSSLHNALLEVALTSLERWQVAGDSLASPRESGLIDLDAESPGAAKPRGRSDEGFIPDDGGAAGDRYKPRQREDDGGHESPPDLSLPGL